MLAQTAAGLPTPYRHKAVSGATIALTFVPGLKMPVAMARSLKNGRATDDLRINAYRQLLKLILADYEGHCFFLLPFYALRKHHRPDRAKN